MSNYLTFVKLAFFLPDLNISTATIIDTELFAIFCLQKQLARNNIDSYSYISFALC